MPVLADVDIYQGRNKHCDFMVNYYHLLVIVNLAMDVLNVATMGLTANNLIKSYSNVPPGLIGSQNITFEAS